MQNFFLKFFSFPIFSLFFLLKKKITKLLFVCFVLFVHFVFFVVFDFFLCTLCTFCAFCTFCRFVWSGLPGLEQFGAIWSHPEPSSALQTLVFQHYWKMHMLGPDWYNRILDYTRKYCKKCIFQWKWHKNLIQYCLVGDFRYFVANLSRWDFLKWPKQAIFWIRLRVLEQYTITSLKVVESGSPRLRITKSGWFKKKSRSHKV